MAPKHDRFGVKWRQRDWTSLTCAEQVYPEAPEIEETPFQSSESDDAKSFDDSEVGEEEADL